MMNVLSRPTTGAEDEEGSSLQKIDPEAQKQRIRQIIDHQKYLFLSSSDSLSSSSSCFSSFDSTRTFSLSSRSSSSSSLVELMKAGSGVSLRKLFDMEHTTPEDLSGSPPITRPVPLWGSDSDDGFFDTAALAPWAPVKPFRMSAEDFGSDSPIKFPLECSFTEGGVGSPKAMLRSRWKLAREKSFKASTGVGMWLSCKGFRFRLRLRMRLRLRRLRIRMLSDVFYSVPSSYLVTDTS